MWKKGKGLGKCGSAEQDEHSTSGKDFGWGVSEQSIRNGSKGKDSGDSPNCKNNMHGCCTKVNAFVQSLCLSMVARKHCQEKLFTILLLLLTHVFWGGGTWFDVNAARHGVRIRWKPGRVFQAELYADPTLICEHEQGYWILLAPPCHLHCALCVPGYNLLESWPRI